MRLRLVNRAVAVGLGVLMLALLAGCGQAGGQDSGQTGHAGGQQAVLTTTVHMKHPDMVMSGGQMQHRFTPLAIQVKAGQTVTWMNDDAEKVAHTVVSGHQPTASGLFTSLVLQTGQQFTYTFAKPGVYSYYCSIHPGMVGSVTVV